MWTAGGVGWDFDVDGFWGGVEHEAITALD